MAGCSPHDMITKPIFEMIRAGMTIDPAYASFTEDALGSLEIGKRADFTVLSRDIMVVPDDEILGTTVDATVIDGTVVYGAL